MFIDHSIEVPLPERIVAELLIANTTAMAGMGEAAYRAGEGLRSRVGPGGVIAKEVVMGFGPPTISRTGVVIPLRWRATGAEALFPSLEGDLSMERRGAASTVVRLRATYDPPLGPLGTLVDRLLLARVARATVADWLERIAGWLRTSAEREGHLHDGAGAHH